MNPTSMDLAVAAFEHVMAQNARRDTAKAQDRARAEIRASSPCGYCGNYSKGGCTACGRTDFNPNP